MKDMHQIGIALFVAVNEQVENVSRQLTGWQKGSRSKQRFLCRSSVRHGVRTHRHGGGHQTRTTGRSTVPRTQPMWHAIWHCFGSVASGPSKVHVLQRWTLLARKSLCCQTLCS